MRNSLHEVHNLPQIRAAFVVVIFLRHLRANVMPLQRPVMTALLVAAQAPGGRNHL